MRCLTVSVVIPTLDAGPGFAATLSAVAVQRGVGAEVEVLVCDSGSSDGTASLARAHGATVIEIPQTDFSHGATRNLLMERSSGAHVAFLTQDAVPAGPDWLATLLTAFTLAPEVGLAFGPYLPRPDASLSVRRELDEWFASFTDGAPTPRIDALPATERAAPPSHFLGHRGFFTDANGCVARAAWEQVPFRTVAYAEDHLLAQDMLRAGWAKVYMPLAGVVHSHDYSAGQWLRRSFDEARAVREIYGWARPPRSAALRVWGGVAGDWRETHDPRSVVPSLVHHLARAAGEMLGGRSERLPARMSTRLSLEHRG